MAGNRDNTQEQEYIDVCYCGDGCIVNTTYCSHCVPTKVCPKCGATYVDLPEKYTHKCRKEIV